MRHPLGFAAFVVAIGTTMSGCVIVSKSDVHHDASLASGCSAATAGGIDRRQLIDATSGFETVEHLSVFCADSQHGRTMLKVSGMGPGGHMERTFTVRPGGVDPA